MPWGCTETQLSGSTVFEDHRGAFLADHNRGRVGVAARHLRHDRSVGDPQPLDTIDAQPRIDHSIYLASHPAGADRVQVGDAALADFRDHLGLAPALRAGYDLLADKRLERRLGRDLAAELDAIDQRLEVVIACQEIEPD